MPDNVNRQAVAPDSDENSRLEAEVVDLIRRLAPANAQKVVIFAMGLAAAEDIYRQTAAASI